MLAAGALSPAGLWRGVAGDARIQPYAIVLVFLGLAYLSAALDATGAFAWAALAVARRARGRGRPLYFLFFAASSALTLLTSNDVSVMALAPLVLHTCAASGEERERERGEEERPGRCLFRLVYLRHRPRRRAESAPPPLLPRSRPLAAPPLAPIKQTNKQTHHPRARSSGADPTLYLYSMFAASNLASIALYFGNPTNLIVAVASGMTFSGYSQAMALPAAAAAGAALLCMYYFQGHGARLPARVAVPSAAAGPRGGLLADPLGAAWSAACLGCCLAFLAAAPALGWALWPPVLACCGAQLAFSVGSYGVLGRAGGGWGAAMGGGGGGEQGGALAAGATAWARGASGSQPQSQPQPQPQTQTQQPQQQEHARIGGAVAVELVSLTAGATPRAPRPTPSSSWLPLLLGTGGARAAGPAGSGGGGGGSGGSGGGGGGRDAEAEIEAAAAAAAVAAEGGLRHRRRSREDAGPPEAAPAPAAAALRPASSSSSFLVPAAPLPPPTIVASFAAGPAAPPPTPPRAPPADGGDGGAGAGGCCSSPAQPFSPPPLEAPAPTFLAPLAALPLHVVPFVLGMFCQVEGLAEVGLVDALGRALGAATRGGDPYLAALVVGLAATVACAAINNQPMTVLFTRALLSEGFSAGAGGSAALRPALFATVVASNVGANFTIVGALAGVMFADIVRRKETAMRAGHGGGGGGGGGVGSGGEGAEAAAEAGRKSAGAVAPPLVDVSCWNFTRTLAPGGAASLAAALGVLMIEIAAGFEI